MDFLKTAWAVVFGIFMARGIIILVEMILTGLGFTPFGPKL